MWEKGLGLHVWQVFQNARNGSPVLNGWIEKQKISERLALFVRIDGRGKFGSAFGESLLVLFRASTDRPGTDADVAHGCGDLIESVSHDFQDGD
jgi:hypothetical protein